MSSDESTPPIPDRGAARAPLRLLHCSDLHLDHAREASALETLTALRAFVSECGAAAMLLAGDLFDRSNQPTAFVERVTAGLSEIDVPIVAIHGNHDIRYSQHEPEEALTTLATPLAGRLTLLSSPAGESVTLLGGALTVWGRGMPEHSLTNDPLHGLVASPDATAWQVALAHGELEEFGSSPIDLDRHAEALQHIDYLALGHHHAPSVMQYGRTVVAYSGAASNFFGSAEVAIVDLTAAGVHVETARLAVERAQRSGVWVR